MVSLGAEYPRELSLPHDQDVSPPLRPEEAFFLDPRRSLGPPLDRQGCHNGQPSGIQVQFAIFPPQVGVEGRFQHPPVRREQLVVPSSPSDCENYPPHPRLQGSRHAHPARTLQIGLVSPHLQGPGLVQRRCLDPSLCSQWDALTCAHAASCLFHPNQCSLSTWTAGTGLTPIEARRREQLLEEIRRRWQG